MLQNAYFLAKIGADTAEIELHFAEMLPIGRRVIPWRRRAGPPARPGLRDALRSRRRLPAPAQPRGPRTRSDGAKAGKVGKISSSKFLQILQIFGGLVLGCIKTKFCKKICVRQHFSSSTRFASFCTAASSKFSQKIGLKKQQISWNFSKKIANVAKFAKFCQN